MTDDGKEKDKKIIRFKPAPTELEKSIGSMMGVAKQLSDIQNERIQYLADQFGLDGELERKTRSVLHYLQFTLTEQGDPPPFMWVISLGWLYRAFNFTQHNDPKRWKKAADALCEYDYETEKSPDQMAVLFGILSVDHEELCAITDGLAMFSPERGYGVESNIYRLLVQATCLGCGLKIEYDPKEIDGEVEG